MALMFGLNSGCSRPITQFEIHSFKNRAAPQRYSEVFDAGYFSVDSNKNHTFIFTVSPTYVEREVETPDDASESTPTPSEPVRMSQTLELKVFWRAIPGSTVAESTQTNANIVYCLTTGRDCITYEGAGFVSFTESRDGQTVTGMLESAALCPARFVNVPADLFGPCHISGTFVAGKDRAAVVSHQLALRRKLGPPLSSHDVAAAK